MDKSVFTLGAEFSALSVQLEQALKQQMQTWQEREDRWVQLDKKIEQIASQAPTKVVLDVGGKKFAASKSTLLSMQDTFFTAMLCSDRWKPNDKGVYFIDRNPKHFGRILDFLRSGKLRVADLSQEQMECLQEELDFYQINIATEQIQQTESIAFIPTKDFEATNNNKTVKRVGKTGHVPAIRLDKELSTIGSYEWTVKLDGIENSQWIALGVGDINTKRYDQIYGISSANQVYPTGTCASNDWCTGDKIHVMYKHPNVTITNKRTEKSHTVEVKVTAPMYPFFDVHREGLRITLVDFK